MSISKLTLVISNHELFKKIKDEIISYSFDELSDKIRRIKK